MRKRNLVLMTGVFCLGLVMVSSRAAVGGPGPTVVVAVQATDTSGGTLRYRWRSTDGSITDVNAASTSWTLPGGPGWHFAYVLVSNGLGGYTERRIMVNTDSIGTPLVQPPPQAYRAPAAGLQSGNYWRGRVNIGKSGVFRTFVPDVQVFLLDGANRYPPAGTVSTDLRGEYVIPGVPAGTNEAVKCAIAGKNWDCSPDAAKEDFMLSTATTHYAGVGTSASPPSPINGRFILHNGPCGIVDEFFPVRVWATATLLDQARNVLAGPMRVNESGDYFLPNIAGADSVALSCEGSTANTVIQKPIPAGGTDVGTVTLNGVSVPTVTNMTAMLNGQPLNPPDTIFLPPITNVPSDIAPRIDAYLAEKGLDTRLGACKYYQAIGAVQGCTASGDLINPITYLDWQRAVQIGWFGTVPTVSASFVNQVDLNLARVHQSNTYVPNRTQTAAVVCNHKGTDDFLNPTQADIDSTVQKALNGKNLIVCVAMDYMVSTGVNGDKPFIRFLIFGPNGQLLPSVNLDGRSEKFVPGSCVVCHGGDSYAGKFPEDNTGFANVGGHFVPYDAYNFAFSSKPGLQQCDQEGAIYNLNQNVLNAGPPGPQLNDPAVTTATTALINGWYSARGGSPCSVAATHVINPDYFPPSWASQDTNFYKKVIARSCRTCHAAMIERYNWDTYTNYSDRSSTHEFAATVCGGGTDNVNRFYTMPNSLNTFNRFWLSPNQPSLLMAFLTNTGGGVCNPLP